MKDPYVLAIHTVDDNDFGKYAIVEGMDYMNPTQKIVILIAHLDVIYAKPGRYDPGDILGKVGSTGTATDDKPHAHIQVGISKDEVGLGLQKRFQNAGLLPKKNKEATQIYGAMTCTQKTAMLKEYAKKQELPEDFYDPLTHLPYQFNLETGECSNCQKDCK